MKIGIITFHAAHNFGSMLQAYALKTYISQQNNSAEIINFRTKNQKDIYAVFTKRKGLKYLLKNAFALTCRKSLNKKHTLFEEFLKNELNCEEEIQSAGQINSMNFDAVIAGSDQIWNINTNDFEWLYFLENITAKKYSYAVSCGPNNVYISDRNRIASNLNLFNAISVRDEATHHFVEQNSEKTATIVCDPVMLLEQQAWRNLSSESITENLPDKFIFLYTLGCDKNLIKVVKQISKELKLPIVIPHVTNQYDMLLNARRVFVSGPKEFLKLIDSAAIVVTSSYHAMLFSIIFDKQFYVIAGSHDNRKRDILKRYNLEQQTIDGNIDITLVKKQFETWNADFSSIVNDLRLQGARFINERICDDNM